MPMYNLKKYSDNYSRTYGSLWKYYRDEPNDNLARIITENTPNNGNTKDVEIIVPVKRVSNFWRTLEMLLIDCEINLIKHGHQLGLLLILQVQEDLRRVKQNFMFQL